MPIIAVVSFKGGTAKTSTALHLGAALAQYHKQNVLLIDFDSQANLTTGLGYDPDTYDSFASVLQGKKTLQEAILPTSHSKLSLIPGDTWLERIEMTEPLVTDRYSHERMSQILKPLNQYDTIIIDTPPSLCWLTESALIASNYALVTATPEFYSVKGLQRLSHFMQNMTQRHSISILGVILSFWNPRGKSNHAFLDIIEQTFPNKVLNAKIRRDISIAEASIHGKPIFKTFPESRGSRDYIELAKELLQRMKNGKS